MTAAAQIALTGGLALAAWLIAFALALLVTRNGTVEPGPATQELGETPEPPAVVSLLANHWRSVDHAAAATLLDLAARRLIELRQPGDDPAHTTVHVTTGETGRLAPYERRVLQRVADRAGSDGAPIGAIAFRAEERAATWNRELRQEVVAEARRRGLSRSRFGSSLSGGLSVAAFVPAVLFGLSVLVGGHNVRAAFAVGAVVFVPLAALMAWAAGERATAAGLARASHWAGVQQWLRSHEEFARLPPAASTVWDRYLAYGAALGVTRRTTRLLGFDAGDRRRVWSAYGGAWRCVRIRYPRLRPGFGGSTGRLLRLAAANATVAVGLCLFARIRRPEWAAAGPDVDHSLRRAGLVLTVGWVLIALVGIAVAGRFSRWTLLLGFLGLVSGSFASSHGALRGGMDTPGLLPAETAAVIGFAGLAGLYLALAIAGGLTPRTVTGEVLRIESRRGRTAPRLLAVDEGTADRTVAWALPAGLPLGFAPGSTVRLTVSPATRRVHRVQVLDLGSDPAQERPAPVTG